MKNFNFMTFFELCIAYICAVMTFFSWGNGATELAIAWTIATVGWLGAGFSGTEE